jgi:hypothetical protein
MESGESYKSAKEDLNNFEEDLNELKISIKSVKEMNKMS